MHKMTEKIVAAILPIIVPWRNRRQWRTARAWIADQAEDVANRAQPLVAGAQTGLLSQRSNGSEGDPISAWA